MLEAVPTIVYGYFALLVLTPFFQKFVPGLGGFNLLVPGIVLGIMILPYVVSVSEDAMRAVPGSLREGAYALGMSRLQTRSEEHTSELQSLMRISYAVFCLKKKNIN